MRKLVVYVEGETEQEFLARFIVEIAGKTNVLIEESFASGGKHSPRTIQVIRASKAEPEQKYYVLIVNCGGESRVASDVRDNYNSHVQQGFDDIIALRDVYPDFTAAEIPLLRTGLMQGIPSIPISPLFVLGVMEVEAWFLAEHRHFVRLHASLTCAAIQATFGFDPSAEDMQNRAHPADDLDKIYASVGKRYLKKRTHRQRMVEILDYATLYLEPPAIPDLQALTTRIDHFIGQ